ncbi:MAG: hypothetical protein KDA44_05565, partial [Planctomycetales bacterium]|nr:hypothetical protein [Planctomycetales bacterium]
QPHGGPRPAGGGYAGNGAAGPQGSSGPAPGGSGADIPPEPIAEFFRETLAALRDSLRVQDWPKPARIAVAALGILAVIRVLGSPGGEDFLGFAFLLAVGYVVYRGIRAHLIRKDMQRYAPTTPSSPAAQQVHTVSTPVPPATRMAASNPPDSHPDGIRRPWRRRQQSWQTAVRHHLRSMSWRDRSSQLLGSMVVAAVVGTLATLFAGTFAGPRPEAEIYLWMAIVTIAGSWAVLIPAKLCEGHIEDQAPLRFAQLLGGAIVGFIAFGVAAALMLQLPTSTDFAPGPWDSLSGEFFRSWDQGLSEQIRGTQTATLAPQMHVAYFAFLLLLLRWWRMAEVTRPTRVSLWSIAWAGFIGWGLTFFWWYPQPVGMLTAIAIAFTVQISSPWMSSTRRTEIAEEAVA